MGRPWQHRIWGHTASPVAASDRIDTSRVLLSAGRSPRHPPCIHYDRSCSSARWQSSRCRLAILCPASSTRARRHRPVCPYPVLGHVPATDADRQSLPARKFPEGKPNPRCHGQCAEEACQSTLVRGAMPNSATQPRRPNLVEPAIRAPPASSSSYNRSFRTMSSRG